MSWRFPVSCLDLLSSPLKCANTTLQFQSMRFSSRYTGRSGTDDYLQFFLMLGSMLFLLEFYHGQFCCLAEGVCELICDLAVNFKTLFAYSVIYYSVCLLFLICYLLYISSVFVGFAQFRVEELAPFLFMNWNWNLNLSVPPSIYLSVCLSVSPSVHMSVWFIKDQSEKENSLQESETKPHLYFELKAHI